MQIWIALLLPNRLQNGRPAQCELSMLSMACQQQKAFDPTSLVCEPTIRASE